MALCLLVNGCGKAQTTPIHSPVTALPPTIDAHLSSYTKRITTRKALPITKASKKGGESISITGTNVLYIDPSEKYAIEQFRNIWSNLSVVPVVVWLNTTPSRATEEWKLDGYKGDPLPSMGTYYSGATMPTPDAYHRMKSGWLEIPGVLESSQQKNWIKFFR